MCRRSLKSGDVTNTMFVEATEPSDEPAAKGGAKRPLKTIGPSSWLERVSHWSCRMKEEVNWINKLGVTLSFSLMKMPSIFVMTDEGRMWR